MPEVSKEALNELRAKVPGKSTAEYEAMYEAQKRGEQEI